jgi:hypothetical protein
MVKVIGTIYEGNNKLGDFNWMIKQAEFKNCLFMITQQRINRASRTQRLSTLDKATTSDNLDRYNSTYSYLIR